jgi:carboxypeptidase family protein
MRLLPATILLCALRFSATSAQTFYGIVSEQGSGTPIRGVFVSLLDARGDRQRGYLTDEAGRFVFRAPTPGSYTLRAERLGYQTVTTEAIPIEEQEGRNVPISLSVAALRLPDVTIQRDQRCVTNPQNAVATARVWEEVGKALTVAAWLQESGLARFRSRTFERELSAALDTVGPEEMNFGTIHGKATFGSIPADSLSRFGFVQQSGEDYLFFGPDAELLTKPEFLDQHCFRLQRSATRPGLLALAFEPRRDQRLPDIKGALWLDEASGALKFIDYEFTNVRFSLGGFGGTATVNPRFANGRTEFEQLPNGAWIVRRWHILTPRIEASRAARGRALVRTVGAKQQGGEVFDAIIGDSSALGRLPAFDVTGTVYDSLRTAPLANAGVVLPGTSLRAQTDSSGRFTVSNVPGGDYYITVEHNRLDSIPARAPMVRIRVDAGTGPFRLATPSRATLLARHCDERELRGMLRRGPGAEDWLSVVLIDVANDSANVPIAEATVRLRWDDPRWVSAAAGVGPSQLMLQGETDERGRFSRCAIIDSHQFHIDVQHGNRSQTIGPITIPPERIVWQFIKLARGPSTDLLPSR